MSQLPSSNPNPKDDLRPSSRQVDSPLRVRYAETDQMGVAYHANHFIWFEVGRTDYCRSCGFTYAQMERDTGTRMMVVEAHCRYKGSVTYDEELFVRTWIKSLRKRVLIFGYVLIRKSDGIVVAEGETVHVTTDSRGKPCSIPDCYLQLLREDNHTS